MSDQSTIVGYVKSFSPATGWGFISLPDNAPDIFFSRSTLRLYARSHVGVDGENVLPGTVVLVDTHDTPRGRQVSQFHRVGATMHPPAKANSVTPPADGDWAMGLLKWYSEPKGYGFVTLQSGADALLHAATIKKKGLKVADAILDDGGWLRVRVSVTGHGLRVIDIDYEVTK